ncbi:Vesicle transport protein SFT2B [Camellia lanceoleosa]|uniref:Vesicle transport protein SFT2B n=1 Tax=Camellia lanceoleosa TaxID=1840588 RepID=A0ACC0IYS3_9ERIC|nr:Vesicle transport protein SFT2B [Camellia lanceoleosa]
MWKLNQSMLGGDEELQDNLLDGQEGLCSISPLQLSPASCVRCLGRLLVLTCLRLGLALSHASLIVFAKPIKFAVLFTFGNMLAVGSTAFVIGPGQQMRMMLDPVRIYATAIYVGCVVLALICALLIHSKVLTILAIISEICALIWTLFVVNLTIGVLFLELNA